MTMFFLVPKKKTHERASHRFSTHPVSLVGGMDVQSALFGKRCSRWKDLIIKPAKEDKGAVTVVLAWANVFERVSLAVVWAWPTHLDVPRKIWRGYFEHQRRVQFEGCVAEPLQAITANFFGSKWSCSLRVVLQDALSEVMKVYPPMKLQVFVDDITACLEGRNKELPKIAEKVVKRWEWRWKRWV